MSKAIPFPGELGGTICLPAGKAVTINALVPQDPEPFRVGDICTFGGFAYRFRVTSVDGDDVTFERIT